jgi:small subunit ribosomal protein S1
MRGATVTGACSANYWWIDYLSIWEAVSMSEELAEIGEEAGEQPEIHKTPESLSELKPKMQIKGTVVDLSPYGAYVDIGVGPQAILHSSKLGKRVSRVSEALSPGDEVELWVETVDLEREQVTVTMIEPHAVDWNDLEKGQTYLGTVTRLEKFGAFVDIGAEKEGLVHVSELSHDYVKHPSEVVRQGDKMEVRVIGFSKRKQQIDLSRKALLDEPESDLAQAEDLDEEEEVMPTAMEIALREAMGDSGRPSPGSKGSKKQTVAKSGREEQDDILSRTLQLGQDSADLN